MILVAIIVPNNYNIMQHNFVSLGTPVIVDAPKNQTIVTSTDTLFTCTATGYPCPNIHWIHNNSNVSNKSIGAVKYKNFIHVAKLKNDLSPLCTIKSTIVIANVTANDYGDYTCKASNIVGNAVAPAQLGTGNCNNTVNTHRVQLYAYSHSYYMHVMYVHSTQVI